MLAEVHELPTRSALLADLVRAERGDGWMAHCVDAGCHSALTREFVTELAMELRRLTRDGPPVLEVCAGNGRLASALREQGMSIVATDVRPAPDAEGVHEMSAAEALRRYEPSVVLGAFVPFDSGVDQAVLSSASVNAYLVLNARSGGQFGASCLWSAPGWHRTHLAALTKEFLTRHDVWLGDDIPVRQYGEAWLLGRADNPSTTAAQADTESIG